MPLFNIRLPLQGVCGKVVASANLVVTADTDEQAVQEVLKMPLMAASFPTSEAELFRCGLVKEMD